MTVLNELSAQLLANYAKKRNQQIDSVRDRIGKDERFNHLDKDSFESHEATREMKKNIKRSEDKWKGKDESERAGTLDRARGFEKEKSVANTVRSALGMKDKDNAEEREKAGKDKAFQAMVDKSEQHDLSRRALRKDATPQEMEAQRKSRVALAQRQVKDISGRDSIRHMASGLKQGAKVVAKAGYNAAKSGLSSLKKRVFGEEYYEDLDYRYTVIPLLDSLLEGNSTDIEYAFNEAVAHRIENAILTARLRIAEELDEARGLIDMGAGYGRRPDSPEERSEVAKALRTARKYNRDTRDFHKAHPNDDKKAQADKMKELNQHAKGSHSGTIKRTMDTGMQYRSGVQMPKVDNPNSQNISARAAVHSDKYPTHLKLPSPIRANQGKASWKKQPEMPE